MKIRENDIRESIVHFRALEKKLGEEPVNKHIRTAIKALEFYLKNRWIPVTERLPDNENDVLITVYKKYTTTDCYDPDYGTWEEHYDDGEVTAWMPFPQPHEQCKECQADELITAFVDLGKTMMKEEE